MGLGMATLFDRVVAILGRQFPNTALPGSSLSLVRGELFSIPPLYHGASGGTSGEDHLFSGERTNSLPIFFPYSRCCQSISRLMKWGAQRCAATCDLWMRLLVIWSEFPFQGSYMLAVGRTWLSRCVCLQPLLVLFLSRRLEVEFASFSHPPHSECQHSRTPVVGACSWAFPMGVANDFLSLLRCFPSNPAVRDTNFNSLSLLWLVHVAVCRSLDGFCFHCCGMSREGTVEDVCTLLIYGGCLHVPLLALHSPVEISNPDCAVLWLQVLSCFPFTVL